MASILITGGAGFIGTHLRRLLLEQGHDVCVLDSLDPQVHGVDAEEPSDVRFIRADVCDRAAVRAALGGVDRVVHLAATVGVGQSMYEIVRYTTSNAVGAATVLEEAIERRDSLEKVVVASSMSIYGEGMYRCPAEDRVVAPPPRPQAQLAEHRWELVCDECGSELVPVPTREEKPLAPASIYAVNKRDHEEMFLVWGRAYGVPVTALRFFNVYGPGQALSNPYTGAGAIFASRLLNGRPPVIYEDGLQTRDFVHVDDVVRAVGAALEPGRADGLAVNVGTSVPTTVLELAQSIARRLGVAIEPDVQNVFRAGDVRHCVADTSLARSELGFEYLVPFDQGVDSLVAWLVEQSPRDLVDEARAALDARRLTV